jgi:hypothetical protein
VGTAVVFRDAETGVLPFAPLEGPGVATFVPGLPVSCAPGVSEVGDTPGVAVVPVGAGVTVTICFSPTDSSFFPSHPLNKSVPASSPNNASFAAPHLNNILSSIIFPPSGLALRP